MSDMKLNWEHLRQENEIEKFILIKGKRKKTGKPRNNFYKN